MGLPSTLVCCGTAITFQLLVTQYDFSKSRGFFVCFFRLLLSQEFLFTFFIKTIPLLVYFSSCQLGERCKLHILPFFLFLFFVAWACASLFLILFIRTHVFYTEAVGRVCGHGSHHWFVCFFCLHILPPPFRFYVTHYHFLYSNSCLSGTDCFFGFQSKKARLMKFAFVTIIYVNNRGSQY